jgi:hypothetical protein
MKTLRVSLACYIAGPTIALIGAILAMFTQPLPVILAAWFWAIALIGFSSWRIPKVLLRLKTHKSWSEHPKADRHDY